MNMLGDNTVQNIGHTVCNSSVRNKVTHKYNSAKPQIHFITL